MTEHEVGAERFPERPGGYLRASVRSYLAVVADLREKGFAPAQYASPGGFLRSWKLRGYDPEAVDQHVAALTREAVAPGLLALPAFPVGTGDARDTNPPRRRSERRQYVGDRQADWRRVGDLPGARLRVTRSRLGTAGKISGPVGEVLLTRRRSTITLPAGSALHFETASRWPGPRATDVAPRQVADSATGSPVLWMRGRNFNRTANGLVLFPGQRYFVFPVAGTSLSHAVMTAISESGTPTLWFRRISRGIVEVVVSPDCDLVPEVLCAMELASTWLRSYFQHPGGG